MKSKIKQNIVLIIILAIGAFFRLYKLGQIPISLYWDEAAIGYDAYALSQWGKDMHGNPGLQAIFPSYGDYKLPVYIWFDSIFVKFFGTTQFAVRLPSAIAGIILIYLIYLIATELFHSDVCSLVSAACFSVLPTDILFSRTGFEGHIAVLAVAFTLWLWLKSKQKPFLLYIASITAALAVYSYFSARIVIPLMSLATFIYMFHVTTKSWKVIFVSSMVIWSVFLLPIYNSPFYDASNQFRLSTQNLLDIGQFAIQSNILRQQSGNTFLTRIIYHRRFLQAKAIATNIAVHFDPRYLFFSGDPNLRHSTGQVGLMYVSWLPFFVLGWIFMLRKQSSTAIWLFSLWLISILPAAIPLEVPHALRSMDASIVFPLILGFSFWSLSSRIHHNYIWIGICLIMSTEFILVAHDYVVHYPSRSAVAWQDGYHQLVNYLDQQKYSNIQMFIHYPDARLYLYFLYFDHISPSITAVYRHNYHISTFNNYNFNLPLEPATPTRWQVTDAAGWQQLHTPPATVLNDIYGNPQFYILKGDQP